MNKKIERMIFFVWLKCHERCYLYKEHKIKYIYKNNKSDLLCVVFAGFPNLGKYPVYNYVRTLWKKKKVNYLFILDDMVNIPTGGSYYLGCSGNYWGIDAIPAMLHYFKAKSSSKRIVTAGSSKGGTCALLYGALAHANYVIAGACQYRIGTYLNCDYHIASLRKLTGLELVTAEAIEELDNFTVDALKDNQEKSMKIWLHYSKEEHTYEEHIKDLVHDLYESGYDVSENVESYTEHGDVGKYFPQYMCNILDLLAGKGDVL